MKKCAVITSMFSMSLMCFIGCSSYSITYNTNPIGAALICEGVPRGYTPLTLEYNKKKLKENPHTQECEAFWMSGARAAFPTDWSEVIKKYPKGVESTLQRPSDVPGLEQDMQFAFQVEQQKRQEAYLRVQQEQQQWQQLNQTLQNASQQLRQSTDNYTRQLNESARNINQQTQRMQQQRQHEEQMQELRRLNNNLQYLNNKY